MTRQRSGESFSAFALRCEVDRHRTTRISRHDGGSVVADMALYSPTAVDALGAVMPHDLARNILAMLTPTARAALWADEAFRGLVDRSGAGFCSGASYTLRVIAESPARRITLVNLAIRHLPRLRVAETMAAMVAS